MNYDYFDNNLFSSTFSGRIPIRQNEEFLLRDSYSMWKQMYEIDISLNDIVKPVEPIIKTHVHIDVKISSLSDLLNIIDKYQCKPEIEYNVDVALLHNIKVELVQLNNMIGMENMKRAVLDQLIYFMLELHIGKNSSEFKHTIIAGPPGTGKTEVAKILGAMYSKIGILKKNTFKKVTRSDLIAGYLGQTAIKTRKVIDECLGGVLFIDEAYSLANEGDNDSFSKECIDTLCEALSDHKDNLMVIIAGYENELDATFFKANRGLQSRFIWRFIMDDYSHKEMMEIFKKRVIESGWSFLGDNTLKEVWFREKKDAFKNFGRDMELLFSCVKIKHGRRIYGQSTEDKKKVSEQDLDEGYQLFLDNKNKKKTPNFMHTIYV
jgi:SpoVK/Ycf46/Vps4 family AAA+-type ATPase